MNVLGWFQRPQTSTPKPGSHTATATHVIVGIVVGFDGLNPRHHGAFVLRLQQVDRIRVGCQAEDMFALTAVVMGDVHQTRLDGDGRLFKAECWRLLRKVRNKLTIRNHPACRLKIGTL